MDIKDLQTGDILIRNNAVLGNHYGIYIGELNGTVIVAENRNSSGIRFVTYHKFLDGKKLVGCERFDGKEEDRKLVLPFLEKLIGEDYDLVKFNCEHFSSSLNERVAHRQTRKSLGSRFPMSSMWSVLGRKRSKHLLGNI
ncbi:MAG: hypothetical protein ACFB10_10235 [Salibacteraceae bacterium]